MVQLVGWTAVEFWAMGEVANVASSRLFGFESRVVWLAVVAVVCTALAIGGPVLVVRRWLERFGIYVLLASAVWITVEVLRSADLDAIWNTAGSGGQFTRDGRLPDWIILQRSPLVLYSAVPDAVQRIAADRYERVRDFPVADERASRRYDQQDALFLPLTGLAGVERIGPSFEIYRLRR